MATKKLVASLLVFLYISKNASALAYNKSTASKSNPATTISTRRNALVGLSVVPVALLSSSFLTPAASASNNDIVIQVAKAGDRVGVELYDVSIGSPPRSVVAIRSVVAPFAQNLEPGLVLDGEFASVRQVQERLARGPFPVELRFRNLAAQGDAISDLGTPIVTAQDALNLAKSTRSQTSDGVSIDNQSPGGYQKTVIRSSRCNIQSRRQDLLEIIYEARIFGPKGPVYDSYLQRGTGQPYQMVLGSGDMLPGVDLGLYDMCPGDLRTLDIPPLLAYGSRGNKLFRIPPDARLFWSVELVSVNSVVKGDTRTRDEMEERAQY